MDGVMDEVMDELRNINSCGKQCICTKPCMYTKGHFGDCQCREFPEHSSKKTADELSLVDMLSDMREEITSLREAQRRYSQRTSTMHRAIFRCLKKVVKRMKKHDQR